MSEICDVTDHKYVDHYYGYVCEMCGHFIPFGSEPWMPNDPDDCPEAYYAEWIGDEPQEQE